MKLSVVGKPVPQGSKTAFPYKRKDGSTGIAMTEGGKHYALKEWRRMIADACSREFGKLCSPLPEGVHFTGRLLGPVVLTAIFYLPRPKSAPTRVVYPATKPDLSKLIRAVEDALSKIAYEDDSRIVDLHVYKRFALNRPPGVFIEIHPAPPEDAEITWS